MVMVGMVSVTFACAFRAYALRHIVYALHLETFGVVHCWYGRIFKTECAVTHLTVKMHVTVIINIAMGMAQFVAHTLTTVINLV